MKSPLLALAASLLLLAPAPAQDGGRMLGLASSAPIYSISIVDGIVFVYHVDNAVTAVHLGSLTSGTPQLSTFSLGGGETEEQTTNGDVPILETCWTDIHGAKQCVKTPVASTSDSGMKRAIATHQALVAAMQKLFPPAAP